MNFLADLFLQLVVIKVSGRVLVQDAAEAIEAGKVGIWGTMIVEDYDAKRQDKSDKQQAPEDQVEVR
jgi:hypothetical protein